MLSITSMGGALPNDLRGRKPRGYKAPAFTELEFSMALERTFSIIKPDATRRNLTGAIVDRLEKAGLRVIASRRIRLSKEQAEAFYGVHRERPFFASLVSFMTSGPVVVQVLEGENGRQEPRSDGCHGPGESRSRHDPQGFRRIHRSQFGSRLGCAGNRGQRNQVLLQRSRY